MKVVFVGDAHIKNQMYSGRPLIKGDSHNALGRLAARCVVGDVSAVVFCGDVFDSRTPSPADVMALSGFVDMCHSFGVETAAIQGNHDIRLGHSWCRGVCGCLEVGRLALESGPEGSKKEFKMVGLDFVPGTPFFEVLEAVEPCQMVVAHQAWAHLDPFDSAPVSPEDIPDQVDFGMAMGHIHIRDARLSPQGKWMVSPGALWSTDVDKERGGWCELDLETLKFEFVEDGAARAIYRFKAAAEALAFAATLPEFDDPDQRPIVDAMVREGEADAVRDLLAMSSRCHAITRAAPAEGSAPVNVEALASLDRGAAVRELAGGDETAVEDVTAALEDVEGTLLESRIADLRVIREQARKQVA